MMLIWHSPRKVLFWPTNWIASHVFFITENEPFVVQEALRNNFESGSTAAVILIVDGQIIAANVGDSKAFLCSESHDSYHQKSQSSFFHYLSELAQSGVFAYALSCNTYVSFAPISTTLWLFKFRFFTTSFCAMMH